MWKKVVALNLAIVLTLVILPIQEIVAFAESLNVEYVLFYKNNGTDESTSVSVEYKTMTSSGSLITYKTNLLSVAPEYTQEGKRVVGYNTNSDGSGTNYELLDVVEKGTFSNNASMPTSIYAQWYDAEDNSILYLSNLGLSESGAAYYIQSGLSDTATLAEGSIFAGKDGKKVVGWQTTDCKKTYFPGQTISITTNMTLIPVSGQNYFKLHYEDYNEEQIAEIVIDNEDDYSWYTNRMYRYEYDPDKDRMFIGWNSKEDGSGEWYVKLDENTPNDLYAQYEDYPEDPFYIILSCSTGLESGKKSEFVTVDGSQPSQAVSLPSKVYNNQKVAYWRQSYGSFYYPAGEDILLAHFGYELYPTIIGDDNQVGLIYSNGGHTEPWLGKYIGINYYMTSFGNMSIYNFNELELFDKENNVFVGYKGNKTGTLYDYYDEIESALENEREGEISKFTAQYEPVENGYVQYFGNGGLTSDGKGQYYEEIDFANITTETYAENKFTHPNGENFLGWSTSKEEPNKVYRPGENIALTEDTILYAQWGDNAVITHNIDYYGDENVAFYKNIKMAKELSYFSHLYRTDSYFKGWNTKTDGSGKWYVLDDKIPFGEVTELYEQRESVPDTEYYYVISNVKQTDGTQLKIASMSTDKETITIPEYSDVRYWTNSETYDNIPRSGFTDETEYIYSPGQKIEISSGTVISPFKPYGGMITYNENFGKDDEVRIQYRMTSPAGLKIYAPTEIFSEISEDRIFLDWNTSPDGTGTSYRIGSYVDEATLYAQWFTENSVINGNCGDNVTWKLTGDGTLTISGNGKMADNSYWNDELYWNYLKSYIKKVVIEEGITYIGEYAFYECINLENVTLAKTVTEIGYAAFADCKSLSGTVTLSSNVTDIGNNVFSGCDSLEGIIFEGDSPRISWSTFRGCTNLNLIGMKSIEDWFNNAYYIVDSLQNNSWDLYIDGKLLEDLVIPDSVTWIRSQTFANCRSIKSVTFHDDFYTIPESCFKNCVNLTKIELSSSISSIGKNAFYNTAFYNDEANWNDGVLCLGNHLIKVKENTFGEFSIPAKVTSIASNAFEGTEITKVYIHSSVDNMQGAFADATNLVSVEIALGATYIPYRAFYNCTNLSEIIVPDSVYEIGQDAFIGTAFYNDDNNWENGGLYIGKVLIASDCDNTGSFTVKPGTKSIANSVFMNSSYDKFILPDSITHIGSQAFYNCTELEEITLPENLEELSWGIFYGCTALKTVTLSDGITGVSNDIFRDCTTLETIYNMPVKLSWLGTPIFTNCTNLKDIYYEGTTAQWQKQYSGYDLGLDMSNVTIHCAGDNRPADSCGKEITWVLDNNGILTISGIGKMYDYEENNTPWENEKENIKEVVITDGVTKVGAYSFKNCPNLVTVRIPDSVNIFGMNAFDCTSKIRRNVYITDLTKWCAVKFENAYANPVAWANLYVNNQLTENLTIPSEVTEICNYAFFACYSLKEIILTENVKNAYHLWFYGCNNVTKITVDSNNPVYCDIDGVLFSKDKTILYQYNRGISSDYYKLPDTVVRIDTQAMNGCNKLKNVVLPDGLVEIGYYSFTGDTSLKEIYLPKSVTIIRQGAFSGCSALETVNYSGSYDEWNNIYIEKENDYLIKAFSNNTKARTKTTVSDDGTKFTVKPINIETGNTIILALYNGDTFVAMQSATYTGEDIPFTTDKTYTNAKVMVWSSLESMMPICEAEIVK